MSDARDLSKLTRQELYDLIWSTPAIKLATDFGISDVALAKRCKRQNIPRPGRGYWARREAGQDPPRKPLPPPPDEVFVRAASQSVAKTLPLPAEEVELHPQATELLQRFLKSRHDSYKRRHLKDPTLPEVTASTSQSQRIARAFHVILNGVEPVGITFRKSQSAYRPGHLRRGQDRRFLVIEEMLLGLDGKPLTQPVWQLGRRDYKPSGLLKFKLQPNESVYRDDTIQEWLEGRRTPLELVIARVVKGIRHSFVEAHQQRVRQQIESRKQHEEWERRHREWEAKEAIRLRQEKKHKHAAALQACKQTREMDVLKASEWWRLRQSATDFINECERRWQELTGGLSAEQQAWLAWARHHVQTLSPFEAGYPDPTLDGAFDGESVPFGGPYPPTRNFPCPPTMPNVPSSVTSQ